MENSFDLLEEKVRKAADLVRKLRKEKQAFEEEAAKAKGALKDAEKQLHAAQKDKGASAEQQAQLDSLQKEIATLRQERTEVRNRIARLVEVLEDLD